MKEILFKAKRVDNGEWVEGDLIQLLGKQGNGRKFIVNNTFGACIDEKGNFINTGNPFVSEVIPETVCQYTGLDDKNGKKIFEGDIVKARRYGSGYMNVVIYFKNGKFAYDGSNHGFKDLNSGLEVIGSIHNKTK